MRLFLLLLLFTTIAQAQAINYFNHFTEKDGLTDNKVQCILRDKQGYLWVGTSNGLNRYDGYNFRHYFPNSRQPNKTVSNEFIADIDQDSAGIIWLATNNGLNRYDPRTETFTIWKNTGRNDGSLPNSLVRNILVDDHQKLWLACDNRDLAHFDPITGVFKTYPWKAFLERAQPQSANSDYKNIFTIRPKDKHELWLHTNFGLFSFDTLTELFTSYPLTSGRLATIKPSDCPDLVYQGSLGKDVLRYDPCKEEWAQVQLPIRVTSIDGRRYVPLVFDFGKSYGVCSQKGLLLMDKTTLNLSLVGPTLQNGFTAPTGLLQAYFAEANGMLWLGGDKGLWLYDPLAQHFDYTALKPENTKDVYNTFCRFTDSKVDGRHYLLDFYLGHLQVYENNIHLKTIALPGQTSLLYEDKGGKLWVGGGHQLFQLDRQSLRLQPFILPSEIRPQNHSIFIDMIEDAAGNYWFATNHAGIIVWQPKSNHWWKPGKADGFIAHAATALFADQEYKTVWIATEDYGLFRYDEVTRKFTLYRQEESNPENSIGAYCVNSVCKDGQGKIWVATNPGGISRFDYNAPLGKEFITLNKEDGLPSNQVFSVVADADGNVWAGTAKGLAWVDSRSLRVRSFGKNDGMISDFLDLPLSLATNEELKSGTTFGYQSFHPDSFLQKKITQGILLTSFKIFDTHYADSLNINYLKQVNLNWQENFFSFDFASVHFSQPQKNEYAYRLRDFDTDWIFTKNNHSASYTNVPPGIYLFEIKSGREGFWNEPDIQLGIYIAPPFWATWWFRAAMVLLFGITIWFLYRWRIGQIRKEAALKTEFNQRIARTEMAALRAQMNPHFVFNCLSSINRFILVNKPNEASDYLTKFSRLIRLILDNSRTETVPLDKELDALKLYMEMEQMRFSDRFVYSLVVGKDVQPEHLEVPPLLFQPFVENAIWHGLMHKKEQGLLEVRVFYMDKKLCVEVEDNGIGRQRAMELKSRSATVHKSLGMKVTTDRLEVINQLYDTNAEVMIDDLENDQGEPVGTKVRIVLGIVY
jgi:ligand-binding sensor domain-containing protein